MGRPFPGFWPCAETNVGRDRLLDMPKNHIKSTQRPQKTAFGRNLTR